MIRTLADLCEFFEVDEPRSLPRRIYKNTDCGASISLQLSDGAWLHTGFPGWEDLTDKTTILAFTLQTIVEGSDATVDSQSFVLPVTQESVKRFIDYMEEEAERLWQEANVEEDIDTN